MSALSSSIRNLDIARVSTRRYFRIAAAAAHTIEMATMKRALIQVDLVIQSLGVRVGRARNHPQADAIFLQSDASVLC